METDFKCPICEAALATMNGSQLDPNDGVTVWCPSAKCPAQEVMGHGNNRQEAFNVIRQKYFLDN